MKLDFITADIILDSRRENTIEVTLQSNGQSAKASIPCGKSKGEYEAFCHTTEYSKQLITNLVPTLVKEDFQDQKHFDNLLIEIDGTTNKEKLGVNVTLSLSIAFLRLFSIVNQLEIYQTIASLSSTNPKKFPLLFFNLINGGLHANKTLGPLPFQEYLVIPNTSSPKTSLELTFKFIESLKQKLTDTLGGIRYGDEGGFVISGEDPELGLKYFQEVVKSDRETFANKVSFGLDAASSSLWNKNEGVYVWESLATKDTWNSLELARLYKKLIDTYPLISIEDPFHQDGWKDWARLNQNIGNKIWLVADDLTVTNVERIKKANSAGSANAILIKPNQIGTVTETLAAVSLAKTYGWKIIVSHRSGETNDSFIADFAFGVGADGLKSGSPLQVERLAKYKRLIKIEDSYIS